MATRLSRIHPYPAMLADELAEVIAERHVERGSKVIDPFCGTGRSLLAAARRGASCVGLDVNPLACLVTLSKSVRFSPSESTSLKAMFNREPRCEPETLVNIDSSFKVDWFNSRVLEDLSRIVHYVNSLQLSQNQRILVATILSATVRKVSFARDYSWKLHRKSREQRERFEPKTWDVFQARLYVALDEMAVSSTLIGSCRAFIGDATCLRSELGRYGVSDSFDVVITSPPYGDSRTTLQYGAMSKLCLSVIRHIGGLPISFESIREIDQNCLGGRLRPSPTVTADRTFDLKSVWKGGQMNEARRRVVSFLEDMNHACNEIASTVRPGGYAVFIVGRRLAGGFRLYLDKFVETTLSDLGFLLDSSWTREIRSKATPRHINPSGRSHSRHGTKNALTMNLEHVLVLRKIGGV